MKNRNCPNCGAPIDVTNNKCEYCGTSYFDLSCIPLNEPFFLTINVGTREEPRIMSQKVYSTGFTLTQESVYGDANPFYSNVILDVRFIGIGEYTVRTE